MRNWKDRCFAWAMAGALLLHLAAFAQESDPAITAWKLNVTNATGQSPDTDIDAVVSLVLADVVSVSYDGTGHLDEYKVARRDCREPPKHRSGTEI